jgi:hypothetical protein
VRVYLPTTQAGLGELLRAGQTATAIDGYAATAAALAELADCSDEEVEFALVAAAAESSAQEQLEAGQATGRRFVLVLELFEAAAMSLDDGAGLIRVEGGIALDRLEAIMADPREVDLTAAADDAVAWYAVQEIADLLA